MFKIIAIERIRPPRGADCCMTDVNVAKLDEDARIAVDAKRACYRSIHKGLKSFEPYVFHSDYVIEGGSVRRTAHNPALDSLYGDRVDVCAIVGENGSGKSSVMELVIRLLNNAAYALSPAFRDEQTDDEIAYSLHFVRYVYARLYFQIDDRYYILEQTDHELTFRKQAKVLKAGNAEYWRYNAETGRLDTKRNKDGYKSALSRLFYSIIINYAAYGFNIYDYRPEWDYDLYQKLSKNDPNLKIDDLNDDRNCWIGSIFHKNDSYQAPIVLNPYRHRGNINYNNEKQLLGVRLFELVRNIDDKTIQDILQGKRPYSFTLDIHGEYTPHQGQFGSWRVLNALNDANLLIDEEAKNYATAENIGAAIVNLWDDKFNNAIIRLNPKDRGDYNRALNYLVYKTIKITHTYDEFKKFHNISNPQVLKSLIDKLYTTDNHITRKLRQTLAYLVFEHYGTSKAKFGDMGKEVLLSTFKNKCIEILDGGLMPFNWTGEDLIPAPCFRTDMWFMLKDGTKLPISQFSTGEKQMVYFICTIIYHIWNIESNCREPNGKVAYKYVNLMIDEIELYFHPRYQTKLLKFLIDALNNMSLEGVKSINIMLATHSPFLLSDIPENNILRLENGVTKPKTAESFGANVYNILHDKFFMDQYMGDIAANYIKKMICEVSDVKDLNEERYKTLAAHINLIGDPYYRNILLKQLSDEYDKDKL